LAQHGRLLHRRHVPLHLARRSAHLTLRPHRGEMGRRPPVTRRLGPRGHPTTCDVGTHDCDVVSARRLRYLTPALPISVISPQHLNFTILTLRRPNSEAHIPIRTLKLIRVALLINRGTKLQ
jgi:hypothetical protein